MTYGLDTFVCCPWREITNHLALLSILADSLHMWVPIPVFNSFSPKSHLCILCMIPSLYKIFLMVVEIHLPNLPNEIYVFRHTIVFKLRFDFEYYFIWLFTIKTRKSIKILNAQILNISKISTKNFNFLQNRTGSLRRILF